MHGDEQADEGRDCRIRLARPNSQARTRLFFLAQLTTCRIGNLTRLIHTLAICVTMHTASHSFSSHSFWTSSSLDVPAGVTQEEGHTGFLIHLLSAVRALIFLARRIQPFLSLVDREVEFRVLPLLLFNIFFAAATEVGLVRFSEDDTILKDLVYLEEEAGVGA